MPTLRRATRDEINSTDTNGRRWWYRGICFLILVPTTATGTACVCAYHKAAEAIIENEGGHN